MDDTQLAQQFVETIMSSVPPERASTDPGRATELPDPVGAARYRITRVIGEGGMGRVVEAEDLQFGRMVALKSMLDRGDEHERGRRFGLEALVTANLDHPGIPAVYERGRDADGNPFYAMRFVRGRNLREAIESAKTLDDRLRLLPALIDVAQTLAFAHARGVIHRDIKPDNVVVGAYGDTVVIDWGVAKLRGVGVGVASGTTSSPGESTSADRSTQTQHGSIVGTPAYMAPEQALGRIDEVDERSDVFSLGALIYHLFAGHPPYHGRGSMAVLSQAMEAEFEPLERVAENVPAGIAIIVGKAMAKDAEQRYASAGQLAEALQEFIALGVRGRESRLVRVFASATSVVMTAFMLLIVAVMLLSVPLDNLGIHRFVLLPIFAAGTALAVVEWWTLGRHRLSPLVIGLAVVVALQGVVMSGMGESEMFAVLAARLEAQQMAPEQALVGYLQGSQIVSQGETVSFQLAAALIVLWAVARYRISRAR
jgi:predicted Ser/Thr protein kinase